MLSALNWCPQEEQTEEMTSIQSLGMVDGRVGEASLDIQCYLEAEPGNKELTARQQTALEHCLLLGCLSVIGLLCDFRHP